VRQELSVRIDTISAESACDLPFLRRTYASYTNSAQGWRPTRNADIRVQTMPACGYGGARVRHYGNGVAIGFLGRV
jgi:hypothetical protein